jgi:hypothetical protein
MLQPLIEVTDLTTSKVSESVTFGYIVGQIVRTL